MGSSRDQQDRIVSTGERPVLPETNVDQPHSPKDERIVSANPSLDAAIRGSSRPAQEQTGLANPGGYVSIIHTPNNLSPYEWDATHGGYAQNMGGWDGYPQYISPEGLHVPPVVYNDNPSLLFHSDFGFNSMPPYILEGQSYSPQQIPFSPTYYPQPAPFGVSSAMHISPTELMTSKSNGESLLIDPWSGYVVPFGSYSGVNFSGTTPLASPVVYPQAMSILGSYEQNTGQLPFHGYAASSSFGGYPPGEPSPSPNYANSPFSYLGSDGRVRLSLDKEGRRERDQDSISITSDSYGNRGPRASRVRGKNLSEPSSSTGNEKKTSASPGPSANLYNQPDFETNYKNAKFFIIKSFSEDNVHKSIKYNVWASTPHGNKKLDAAYHEAKEMGSDCPVFLYFSANASGQFCGVAEMVGPVNFEKDAEYWLQDRWSGQFPVKWHIIKDVPNSRFRHIQLQNNDNKPVTHSRDSQEVKLEQGLEMLKIFKDYDSRTSLIDDFVHYDEREKALGEKKQTELVSATTKNPSASSAEDSLNQISDRLRQTLTLEDSDENRQANETDSRSRKARIDESLGAARSPSLRSEKKSISAASADDKQN